MAVALPTEKTPVALSASTAKVLLYGPTKIGKSTLCSQLNPDHTLFLACEPGLGGLETFQVPVRSWEDFRGLAKQLAEPGRYQTVIVDTVDELWRFCTHATMQELGITHPSDLEWGKGWNAVSDKFRLGVGYLASLGLGIWFISHSKDVDIKSRVGSYTKAMPTVGGGCRDFLLGFCDYVFFATFEATEEGEKRVIRTAATENWEAGARLEGLADPLALDAALLSKALGNGR